MKRWARQPSAIAYSSAASAAPVSVPSADHPDMLPTSMPSSPPASTANAAASKRGTNQPMARASARQRLHLLREAITGAAHGFDHARALHGLQRLAQPFHVDVDGALLDEDM